MTDEEFAAHMAVADEYRRTHGNRAHAAITATANPERGWVRIELTAPDSSHASMYWAVVLPDPDEYSWNTVTSVAPLHREGVVFYHHDAPLNVELSYKALLFGQASDGRLFADEDYTETVTATLRPAEWRLK